MQWGYEITFTAKTIVFPCPYAEIIPSVIGASSGSSAKLAINANSLTSFNASNQAAQTIWWIAIGKQQWGYIQTPSSTNIVNLNVPYTSTHYACFAQKADTKSGNSVEAWAAVTAISLTDFTLRAHYDNTNYFLSFGKQQWGYLSFSAVVTAQKVITYPIALSEIALPVAIAIAENYGNDAGLAINNDCMGNHYSSCEFNVVSYGTQRCVGIIFVVIGKQQWGYIEQIKLEPISFLISLQSLFIVLAHSYGQAPIGTWTFHSIIKDAKITGFQLTAGQYNSEAAAYLGIGGYWLIIGTTSQQWGYQAVHGNAEQEFSLPIAFTNNPYTVAISTSNTGNHAACKGFTLSTIILDAGDSVNVDDNIGFIILGKQQWGYATTTITLPIVFNNTDYSVALTKADTSSGGAAEAWVAITNKTNDTVTWRGQWTSHINWFAIGRQQKHINSCYSHFRKFEMLCLLLLFQRC